MSIYSNGRQCEYTNIDAEHLDEWAKRAHKIWQVPPLQQCCLELQHKENDQKIAFLCCKI